MNQLSFFDKIQVLFQLLFSSPIIIGIFAFSMILMIMLFFYSRLNKKIVKYVFIGLYIVIIGFAIIKYGSYFLTSLDSFVTLFMANIYFPIIPVYIVIMLISFIIMIITLSSRKKSRVVKIINTVFFTLIQMLFAVFIYIVESNDIDLSSNTGLYTNDQTMTLLELGMGLFFIWMVILLVIFYLKKADKIFKVKKNVEQEDFDVYINDYNEPNVSKGLSSNNVVNSTLESNVNTSLESGVTTALSGVSPVSNVSLNDSIPEISSNNFGVNGLSSNDLDEPIIEFDEPINDFSNSFVSNNSVNQFNNNIVNNMSTEFKNGFSDPFNSGFSSNSFDNEVGNVGSSSSSMNVFDNFNFLDSSLSVERKNDDVEVIDFD